MPFTPDKKTIGGFFDNVINSGGNLVGDLANTVLHPIDTAKSLYNLGTGIIQLAIPGEQGNEELARAVGKFYVDRYGSLDKAWNSLYNDPIGVAMDASVLLGSAGAGLKGIAGLATVGAEATDLASNAARIGRLGSKLSEVGAVVDPLNIGSKAKYVTGRFRPNIGGKLSGALASESENILTRGMGNPMSLKKARGVSPVSMNELFSKYNLYERSPEAFTAGANKANQVGRVILESAPASIETRNIIKIFDNEIAKLSEKAKTSSKAQLAMQELMNRKQMFLDGIQNSDISTPLFNDATKVYDIKSAFQGDLPPTSFGMPSGEIGKNLGIKKAYKGLLTGIEDQAPGIKNVGREQSALLKLRDIAESQQARGAAKQNINVHRMGGAISGGILAGVPGAVGGFVAERVANSPQFLGGTSKVLQIGSDVIGKGVSIPVPQSVGNFGKAGYNYARVGRMANVGGQNLGTTSQTPAQQPTKSVTYKPSIAPKQPTLTTEIKWKKPKNAFKNNAAFGKSFTLRARN